MKKRGFTLIELLAVIVVLAIIALIATPIVMNVIENSKKGAAERSAENYIDAVETTVGTERIDGNILEGEYAIQDDGNLCPSGETCTKETEIKIDMSGNKPSRGTIIIGNGKVLTSSTMKIGDYLLKLGDYLYTIDKPKSFGEDSWETIAENVKIGNTSAYKVGDTKEITLTGFEGTYTVRIANTSTPEECNQSGFSQSACGFVIEFADGIIGYNMNPTSTNVGGWENSAMRTYVNNTIYNALPQELKSNIIDTTVVSSHGSSDSSNFTSMDKLYLLSLKEVWGDKTYASENNKELNVGNLLSAADKTRQLDYYQGISLSDHNKTIKDNNDGQIRGWWLRGCLQDNNKYFNVIRYRGLYSNSLADISVDVSPAFRIG